MSSSKRAEDTRAECGFSDFNIYFKRKRGAFEAGRMSLVIFIEHIDIFNLKTCLLLLAKLS